MANYLSPTPIQDTFLIPGSNTPGNGVQLFCYAAGTTTKTTVYKDGTTTTAWSNPIVLDSGGNLPLGGTVWQQGSTPMKFVYAPSNDTDPPASPYRTLDNYVGIADISSQISGIEWIAGPTPTFSSATQFTLVGDQRATFTVGRRVKTTNTGGTVYSTITSVSFAAGTTTVNLANDASTLDAGLSAVSYGLLDPTNPSISATEVQRKGAAIASSGTGTTDIWSTPGDYVHVTGTNTINFFSSAPYAGAAKMLIFDGALQINSSAAMLMASNVTTNPNDRMRVRADTISTYILDFGSAAGNVSFDNQASSVVLAGPASGAAARPTWRSLVGAEASLTLIGTFTFNNTSAALITSAGFTGTLDEYELHITDLMISSANAWPVLQVSLDQGATFKTATTDYSFAVDSVAIDNSTTHAFTNNASTIPLAAGVAGSGMNSIVSTAVYRAVLRMTYFGSTTKIKALDATGAYAQPAASASTHLTRFQTTAHYRGTASSAINGLLVSTSSGLISTMTAYLYGLRKA